MANTEHMNTTPKTIKVLKVIETYRDNKGMAHIVITLDGRRIKTHKTPEIVKDAGRLHYHAGHNMPGYLPESDVYTCETFEDAKQTTIADLDLYGDQLFIAGEHDSGDTASEVMEDLNLESGPEWGAYVGDLYYWISPCTDDCDTEDM